MAVRAGFGLVFPPEQANEHNARFRARRHPVEFVTDLRSEKQAHPVQVIRFGQIAGSGCGEKRRCQERGGGSQRCQCLNNSLQ
jgi:hypothetical protein